MTTFNGNGIATPTDNDVLSGRGKSVNGHAGNKRFRQTVQRLRDSYYATSKTERPLFAKMLVNEISNLQPSGRFLKQDPVTKLWYEISNTRAWEKTRQAFREGGIAGKPKKNKNARQPNAVGSLPRSGSSSSTITLASSTKLRPIVGQQNQAVGLFTPRIVKNSLPDYMRSSTMGSTPSTKLQPILGPDMQVDELNRNAESLLKRSILNERPCNNLLDSNTESIQHSLGDSQFASISGEVRDTKNSHYPHSIAYTVKQHAPLKANSTLLKESDTTDAASILQYRNQRLSDNVNDNPRDSDAPLTPHAYQLDVNCPYSTGFDQDHFNNKGKISLKCDRKYSEGQSNANNPIETLSSSPSNTTGLSSTSGVTFGTTVLGSRHRVSKRIVSEPPKNRDDTDTSAQKYHGEDLSERTGQKESSDLKDYYMDLHSKTSLEDFSHDHYMNALHSRFSRRDSDVVTKMEDILSLIADEASYADDISLGSSICLTEDEHSDIEGEIKCDHKYSEGQSKINKPIESLNQSFVNMSCPSNTTGLSNAYEISFGATVLDDRHPVSNISEPARNSHDMDIYAHNSSLHHRDYSERIGEKGSSNLKDHMIPSSKLDHGERNEDEDYSNTSEDMKHAKRRHSYGRRFTSP